MKESYDSLRSHTLSIKSLAKVGAMMHDRTATIIIILCAGLSVERSCGGELGRRGIRDHV